MTATVTSTGTRAGSEVVQPSVRDIESQVYRQAKELRAFAEVHLGPGESQQVTRAQRVRWEHGGMRRWESWARLDLGDHGMGMQREDPQRVGFIELTDRLRWVPREGDDWSVPITELTVRTPLKRFGRPHDGIEVIIPSLGSVRVRALAQAPGTALPAQTAYQAQSGRSKRLLKELLTRGATYDPVE